MKEIQLFRKDGQWVAMHLVDGDPDYEVADLFEGEIILPTPFRDCYPAEEVLQEIRVRNPGVTVTVEEE